MIITIPNNCKTEAQRMAFSARMRRLLQNKGLTIAPAEFLQWHMDYQLPLIYEFNRIWGEAYNDARFASYGQGIPPWFDADPETHWNGTEMIYPPGIKLDDDGIPINPGSVQSFKVRLAEKMGYFLEPHADRFALFGVEMDKAKAGCEADDYWGTIWP